MSSLPLANLVTLVSRKGRDDEKGTSGISDCPRVLPRGRGFYCRRLMPGDVASKAAARVTSFLAS